MRNLLLLAFLALSTLLISGCSKATGDAPAASRTVDANLDAAEGLYAAGGKKPVAVPFIGVRRGTDGTTLYWYYNFKCDGGYATRGFDSLLHAVTFQVSVGSEKKASCGVNVEIRSVDADHVRVIYHRLNEINQPTGKVETLTRVNQGEALAVLKKAGIKSLITGRKLNGEERFCRDLFDKTCESLAKSL